MNAMTLLIVCVLAIFFLYTPPCGIAMSKGPFKRILLAFGGLLQESINSPAEFFSWFAYFKRTNQNTFAVNAEDRDLRVAATVSTYLIVLFGASVSWTKASHVRSLTEAENAKLDEEFAKLKQGVSGNEPSITVCDE